MKADRAIDSGVNAVKNRYRTAAWMIGCLLGMVVHLPSTSIAQPPTSDSDREARVLYEYGSRAFDEGRFREALQHFQHAYDLSHRPGLLFNIGLTAEHLREEQVALD